MRPWLLIPIAFFAGLFLTPKPAPKASVSINNPTALTPSPAPVAEHTTQTPPGASKPFSLNAIDFSKRLTFLLKIHNAPPTNTPFTLTFEQERLRFLAEMDAADTGRILGDLWNLRADPAGPRTLRDLGLPTGALASPATSSLERLLIERFIDLDRQAAWNLAALRSQTRALALNLKHLRKILLPSELLTTLLSLKPDTARETHGIYLSEPETDGANVPPLIPAESLSLILTAETLRWFNQGALMFLEELVESSLETLANTNPKQTAIYLADILAVLNASPLSTEARESVSHDLVRKLHRSSDPHASPFLETLTERGLRALVDAYRGTPDPNPDLEPEHLAPSLRLSGAAAFKALTNPTSPLADNPAALHTWFLTLCENPYREGFLDAALEHSIDLAKNHTAGPDFLTLGTPEERVAFFIDWFERSLATHKNPLETRALLSSLHLPADELAAVLNHIAPLRNP